MNPLASGRHQSIPCSEAELVVPFAKVDELHRELIIVHRDMAALLAVARPSLSMGLRGAQEYPRG